MILSKERSYSGSSQGSRTIPQRGKGGIPERNFKAVLGGEEQTKEKTAPQSGGSARASDVEHVQQHQKEERDTGRGQCV